MHRSVLLLSSVAIVTGLAVTETATSHSEGSEDYSATAVLKDAAGQKVGSAALQETPNGVLLTVDLAGVPAGAHAFHIHEHGRCDPPSFDSAGEHFALHRKQHGFLDVAGPHAGDLPNIHVPEDKRLSVEILARGVTIGPGDQSIADADGAALVIHADRDDYKTQPAGEAGKRIACGVITR